MKVGDVVRLKSGGPKMTVLMLKPGEAVAGWFFDGGYRETTLPPAALEAAADKPVRLDSSAGEG